jgi:DNA polymerase iota
MRCVLGRFRFLPLFPPTCLTTEDNQQVFLDVTELIDYNASLLNQNDLENSFFHLDNRDPTLGFVYDAERFCGPTFPVTPNVTSENAAAAGQIHSNVLNTRLILGSHLAYYLRIGLKREHGYTAAVGVSTVKLLAKLVGIVHKPDNQTTLLPPYAASDPSDESNVTCFLDGHEISKIPGIGFKSAHKLRTRILGRESTFEPYSILPSQNQVTVRDVRLFPGMGPTVLDKLLGGPGSPRQIGMRVWELINGVDPTEVLQARSIPMQISIEDSYGGLDSFYSVKKELKSLASSLISRMRIDLAEDDSEGSDDGEGPNEEASPSGVRKRRWLAHPRTLRLSTRPRAATNADGSRNRPSSTGRISRSAPAPSFIFNLNEPVEALAEKLVKESLITIFRKLHPEKSGWNLSLINIAVNNMVESASEQKQSSGRDIAKMLRRQESVLKAWRVCVEESGPSESIQDSHHPDPPLLQSTLLDSGIPDSPSADDQVGYWMETDDEEPPISSDICKLCGAPIPHFALAAHALYHAIPESPTDGGQSHTMQARESSSAFEFVDQQNGDTWR